MDWAQKSFEKRYQQRKAAGCPGWSSEASYLQMQATLLNLLAEPFAPKSGRALELGCGAGNTALWLAERGFEACGMDLVPTAIEWARENAARRNLQADFRVGDVTELDCYATTSFDLVVDGNVLHCIIGAQRRAQHMQHVFRVLKPAGAFLTGQTCWYSGAEKEEPGIDPKTRLLMHGEHPAYFLAKPEEVLDEVARAGFELKHWRITQQWAPEAGMGSRMRGLNIEICAVKPKN
jgi:SAM-dependent methyltransferase